RLQQSPRSRDDLLSHLKSRPIASAVDRMGGGAHPVIPTEVRAEPFQADDRTRADTRVPDCGPSPAQTAVELLSQLVHDPEGAGRYVSRTTDRLVEDRERGPADRLRCGRGFARDDRHGQ